MTNRDAFRVDLACLWLRMRRIGCNVRHLLYCCTVLYDICCPDFTPCLRPGARKHFDRTTRVVLVRWAPSCHGAHANHSLIRLSSADMRL